MATVAVVGAGLSGLTAARGLSDAGHRVVVVDKGRRPGGRLATEQFDGGARADKGAQFFTVRTPELAGRVRTWTDAGLVGEWCRGFGTLDGHPRYVVRGGTAGLAAHLSEGLDVRSSVHVEAVRPGGRGWVVSWPGRQGGLAGVVHADVVVLTSPVPQSAALLAGTGVDVPDVSYDATLSLTVALDGPAAVPEPGGVQLVDDPVWSWVGDNLAKGTSPAPAVTLHTTAAQASARWDDGGEPLLAELLEAAAPWLGRAGVLDARVHRWRYATPTEPRPERCLEVAPGLVLAGDAFGGPRVEGAFQSGLAAARHIGRP